MLKSKKLRNLFLILSIVFIACGFTTLQAKEETTNSLSIVEEDDVLNIELNDSSALNTIKEYLLTNNVQYQLNQKDKTNFKKDVENSELIVENLDFTKLGKQEITATLKVNYVGNKDVMHFETIKESINVNVIDTKAPIIHLSTKKLILDYNESYDPMDYFESVEDNDLTPITNVDVANPVDIKDAGTYYVTFTAVDPSGNIGEEVLTVKVKEKVVVRKASSGNAGSISSMLDLINAARAERGLGELSLAGSSGQAAASVRASEAEGYVSHTRPNGKSYKTALSDQGVSFSSALEVLTYSGSTVQEKFDWWMNSSGHRNILMNGNYSTIAIGYSGKMWAAIVYK